MKWSDSAIFLLGCLLVFVPGAETAAGSEITVSAALIRKGSFEGLGRHVMRWSRWSVSGNDQAQLFPLCREASAEGRP